MLMTAMGRIEPIAQRLSDCLLMREGQTAMMALTQPPQIQTSVCSAISKASSTSMPK